MKIVKVTYTTTPAYTEQNKANIKVVMNDLQNMNCPGINYNVCVCADDKTFIHTAFSIQMKIKKRCLNYRHLKIFRSS